MTDDLARPLPPRLEHILGTVLERMPIIVLVFDRSGTVTLAEGSGLRALGHEPGALLGESAFTLFQPEPDREAVRQVLDRGTPMRAEMVVGDTVLDYWVEPLHDESGTRVGAVGVGVDVSALYQARQRAGVFEAFVEGSGELVAYADLDERLQYVNPAGRALLGLAPETPLIGVPIADFMTAPTRRLMRTVALPAMMRTGHWEGEGTLRHRDGRAVPVHASTFLVRDARTRAPVAMAAIMRDITEQQQAAEAVRRSADQQRALLTYLYEAQEVERRRIAEGIHDDTVQVMAAVMLRLQSLRRRVSGDPALSAELAGLDSSVGDAAGRLRSLLFELAPPFAGDDDLGAVLRRYAETVFADQHVRPQVDVQIAAAPAPDVRDVLLRISQEALTNVRRHSRASQVGVTLREEDAGYRLRILDDGIGIPPDTPTRRPGHLGLAGMADRATAAGGHCTVGPHPGGGTLVDAWVPARIGDGGGAQADPGRLLGEILGSIGEGFVAVDDRWCLVHVNRRAAEEIGQPADVLTGKDMWAVLPALARSPYAEDVRRALAEQVPVAVEAELSGRWYEMRAYPSSRGLSMFFRDVTRQRRERSRAAELARTTLVGGGVLAAVTGIADLPSALQGACAALRSATRAREVKITIPAGDDEPPLVVVDGAAAPEDDVAHYPLEVLGAGFGTLSVSPAEPEDAPPPQALRNVTRIIALRLAAGGRIEPAGLR